MGQPARSERDLVTFGANLAVKIAPGSRLWRSPRRNLPINSADNKLAGVPLRAPTKSSGSPAPISQAPSYAPTPGPTLITASASAVSSTNNELFKQFMQAYVAAQPQRQDTGPRERPLKACFPEMYSGNLHRECYKFRQQCEDHFDTARAIWPNRIPFAASFLWGKISRK